MPGSSQPAPQELLVTDLTHEGKGVARTDGKVVFIDGALPQEVVRYKRVKRRKDYDEGELLEILEPSPYRIEPGCPHFGVCGGCSLQHLVPAKQIEFKQKVLINNLERIGKVTPEALLPPVLGNYFGYRRRARLGVKYVEKKQKLLVGFREKGQSRYLADLDVCLTVDIKVGQKLPEIARFIADLDCFREVPQIEVSVGENQTALVFRHLTPLQDYDKALLSALGQENDWQIYSQPGGPSSVVPLWPFEPPALYYSLPEYDIKIQFEPLDFIQINAEINKKLVNLATAMLEVGDKDKVVDLFCGLGNFSLPFGRKAHSVFAVEGDGALVERGRMNAVLNSVPNVEFHQADLDESMDLPAAHKVLIDPPRSGAQAMLKAVAGTGAKQVLYVSCNPATLARDAGILCSEWGYRLKSAGVLDMFPQTAHVESMALFEK